jgi:hypothetical protein
MQTLVAKAAFLMVVLSNIQASIQKLEQNNLRLLPAEPLSRRTLAVPFVFVANDASALSVNILKRYAGHNPEVHCLREFLTTH